MSATSHPTTTTTTQQQSQRLTTNTQRTVFNGPPHRRRYGRTFHAHQQHQHSNHNVNNNHHSHGNLHVQQNHTPNHLNNSNLNINNSSHNIIVNNNNNNTNINNHINNNNSLQMNNNQNVSAFPHSLLAIDVEKFKGCPWRTPGYIYGRGVLGLHEEIEQFYNYIMPTPTEYEIRNELVQRIENVVHSIWPTAIVEIFGSFRTGLFLPTSDIDLVVLGMWEKPPLRTLECELIARGVTNPDSVRVLDKAVVPLIKLTSREFNIKVDISFNMQSGVQSAEMIKIYKQEYALLPKLVMVLKQFLMQRELNEVFTGGISSYSLILMCISFFQLHPRQIKAETANLGVLLLEFFELYGRKFNYGQVGISIRNGGSYIAKDKIQGDVDALRASFLCIEDPLTVGNDIGRGSYRAVQMKQSFEFAYMTLSQSVTPQTLWSIDCTDRSILGRIIRVDDQVIEHREWVRCNFEHLTIKLTPRNDTIALQSMLPTSNNANTIPTPPNCIQFAFPAAPVNVTIQRQTQPPVTTSTSAISITSQPLSPAESSISLGSGANSNFMQGSCVRGADVRNRDQEKKKRNKPVNSIHKICRFELQE